MSSHLHERFDRPDLPLPSDRSTGFVFAAMALLLAFFLRANTIGLVIALALSVVLGAVSILAPVALRPLNIAWMRFAALLSKVINPIIMLLLFAIAIVPSGLIMQRLRDPLRRQRKIGASTYWIQGEHRSDTTSMKNQF